MSLMSEFQVYAIHCLYNRNIITFITVMNIRMNNNDLCAWKPSLRLTFNSKNMHIKTVTGTVHIS